ncbi:Cytochrome P450 monooxygenase nodJ [Paramyrothecium foliicola]|nr:Cytochrome P450 monooxygenase nodJ [Paramyrothecium foliicola]
MITHIIIQVYERLDVLRPIFVVVVLCFRYAKYSVPVSKSLTIARHIFPVFKNIDKLYIKAHHILWRKPSDGYVSLHPNPHNTDFLHLCQKPLHKQLLTPGSFHDMIGKVTTQLELTLRWDHFRQSSLIGEIGDAKLVSLNSWVRDIIINSQTLTFFGPYLFEIEPAIALIFSEFDWNSWMLTYQYPSFLCKAATKPRERLINAFLAYIDAPRELRAGEKVEFMDQIIDEMRHAGISTEDCARLLMILMWGVNANAQMTNFWIMTEILQRPSLIKAIRTEIAPTMEALTDSSRTLTEEETVHLLQTGIVDSCPILNSTYNETLRMYSTGSSIRITQQESYIDDKRIPEGVKLLLPQRQLLLDPEVYGPDSQEFNAWRFINNKKLDRHEFFKPYGGGVSYCRGKAVGRYEVLAFVAWTLWRYECNIVGLGAEAFNGVRGKTLPRIDAAKPSVGISKPRNGDDLLLTVRERMEK